MNLCNIFMYLYWLYLCYMYVLYDLTNKIYRTVTYIYVYSYIILYIQSVREYAHTSNLLLPGRVSTITGNITKLMRKTQWALSLRQRYRPYDAGEESRARRVNPTETTFVQLFYFLVLYVIIILLRCNNNHNIINSCI